MTLVGVLTCLYQLSGLNAEMAKAYFVPRFVVSFPITSVMAWSRNYVYAYFRHQAIGLRRWHDSGATRTR